MPFGISSAAAMTVGNFIGMSRIDAAKAYAKICTLSAFIWGLASILLLVLFKESIILIFSSEEKINV
jgi:Na+-driven multidrug efflux pump